ncbi:MAG: DUF3179 domain-containing protein [Halobacteriales archaeon]
MDRRAFLASTVGAAMTGLTGCLVGSQLDETAGSSQVSSVAGVDLPLPEHKLTRGAPKDAIPAITDPVFAADWRGLSVSFVDRFNNEQTIEPRLEPADRIIGVERDGAARAYPLRILNWHEVVNDTFQDPLLVTYCPLCGSGVTAKRTVNDTETIFGVSGYLWNSDLVMYDNLTQSLWSQIAGVAVRGPETGTSLSFVPSTFTTWATWRNDHPETTVLLPPPESSTVHGNEATRDYTTNPYAGYEQSSEIGIGANETPAETRGLHPKAPVLGIVSNGAAKAYPLERVKTAGVINDTVGDLPVVVTVAADDRTLVGYIRRIDGAIVRFERASETHMRANGSRWKITTGQAVDGPHAGMTLTRASDNGQMMWFAWLDFQSDTDVYTDDQ